ncbi:MAG: AAA family ATPase [Desulfurococcales archaeon]|nr:AAA family ATPase [Desulfurococcales archaeon]
MKGKDTIEGVDKDRRLKLFDLADKLKKLSQEGVKKEEGFRIVVTGKGGAGKTTIAAILSRIFAKKGYKVLAVDEDPQMNLPYALGIPREIADTIVPLSRNADYIEEKTGARPGAGWGLYLRLNPEVDDVIEKFGVLGPDKVRVLVMGTVVQAATGCLCPENALLDAVMNYITLRENEVIVMDTQAGMEHFGRAMARGFHHAVIVVNPSFNSVQVGLHLAKLANDLNIKHVYVVINKVRNEKDVKKVEDLIKNSPSIRYDAIETIPYDEVLLDIEPSVEPLVNGEVTSEITGKLIDIAKMIEEKEAKDV